MVSPIKQPKAVVASTATIFFIVCFVFVNLMSANVWRSTVAAQTATATVSVTNARGKATATAFKIGEMAPDFRLPYATQEKFSLKPEEHMSLSSLRGRNVILAFYPADWSGGCTREVCALRDTFAELSKLNATVLGISGDYVFSHHEWAKYHKLQFPLLSDHDHKVARLYESFSEESGYNKRTVFLIDKTGIVRYSNLDFRAGDAKHYAQLRAELEKVEVTLVEVTIDDCLHSKV